MRWWTLVLVALASCLGLASPAWSGASVGAASTDPTLVISPDERLELTLDVRNGVKLVSRGPATKAIGAALPSMDMRVEELRIFAIPGTKPKPSMLAATLWSSQGGGTRLMVENGYDYPVIYQAFLIFERNGKRAYRATSICPVLPGKPGVEAWPEAVAGIAIRRIEGVDPAHMACNEGSALTLAPELPKDNVTYICLGGASAGVFSPLIVEVEVDSAGSVRRASARWSRSSAQPLGSPALFLDYPLTGDVAVNHPDGLNVLASVRSNPPPTAKSASVVLSLNGVEKMRRPWRMYAQFRSKPYDPAKPTAALVGMIPFFVDRDGHTADAGLQEVLEAVGRDGQTIGVRIVGDDGSVLGEASYAVDHAPVHSRATIDPLLAEALGKAKTLSQCTRQDG